MFHGETLRHVTAAAGCNIKCFMVKRCAFDSDSWLQHKKFHGETLRHLTVAASAIPYQGATLQNILPNVFSEHPR